jgi:hypothetical protein
LDVLSEPHWVLALVMHLIPSFILVLLTTIAWKNEKIGGIFFLIAGVSMVLFFHSMVIAVPAFVIGILFFANWHRK